MKEIIKSDITNAMKIKFLGTGSALPKQVCTNDDLVKRGVETSDEWVKTRTGISQRYICGEGESTSTLAIVAANKAIANANISPSDIDLIITATSTPDLSFPGVSAQVQQAIQNHGATAFDVQAACSGFLYALSTAEAMLKSGKAKTALIIGAENFTKLLDWNDRSTCVLFGDGAGAAVVQIQNEANDLPQLLGIETYGDGQYLDLLKSSGGVSTTQTAGHVLMNGREVFKNAVRNMSEAVHLILEKHNLEKEDVKWLIPHQANVRIIESIAKHVGLSMEQVVLTVAEHANTSAASIPLALDSAVSDSKLQKGDLVMFLAFGAGFSWSAGLARW